MIEITLNENGSVSNREIFIGFTGENIDKTLHFTYPEKYKNYHKYVLVNHSVDGTFGVLPINDDKFVVSTYLTSKKYGWELQVMFTEDELDLSAETVDLSPKEGKHQKLFKKIWCGIDRGLYSGEAINVFEQDENVQLFYEKVLKVASESGASGGSEEWTMIDTVTLKEAVSCVNVQGNGHYNEMYIGAFIPANSDLTSAYSFGVVLEDQDKLYGGHDNSIMMNGILDNTKKNIVLISVEKKGNKFVHTTSSNINTNENINDIMPPNYYSPIISVRALQSPIWKQTINELTGTCCIVTQNNKFFPENSYFEIYAR